MANWLIGIDGGGSKTLVLLADGTGRVVGQGTAGPSNDKLTRCAALA